MVLAEGGKSDCVKLLELTILYCFLAFVWLWLSSRHLERGIEGKKASKVGDDHAMRFI